MAGKTGETIAAVLAGAAIGAALGILFAPEQGNETRRKIKQGYGTRRDGLMEKLNELSDQVRGKFSSSKEDLETGFDRLVANVEEKKDDIITTLEKKLENLKSASAKDATNTSKPGSVNPAISNDPAANTAK